MASSFIAGNKWPIEEIRLGRIIAETEDLPEELEEQKNKPSDLDALISETGTIILNP